MLRNKAVLVGFLASWAIAAQAHAADWSLDTVKSSIAVGSIHNGTAGESETLRLLSGSVGEDGAVEVQIDAQSAHTLIELGNPELVQYAFNVAQPTAVLRTKIDREQVEDLRPGERLTLPVSGLLVLSGIPKAVDTRLYIHKESDSRVLVTSDDRATVDMDDLGKTTGLTSVVQMLGLSGVKRTTTVAMNLVFEETAN